MGYKRCILLIIASVLFQFTLFNVTDVHGEIRAKPGAFDRFRIDIPDRIKVGADYEITVIALDVFDNPIDMPKESLREFRVVTTGSAKLSPTRFVANEITQRGFRIKLRNDRAEEFTVSIYEVNKLTPIFEKKVRSIPDSLSSIHIVAPTTVGVGSGFQVQIFGTDRFGNRVCEEISPKTLNLLLTGDISPEIKGISQVNDLCVVNVSLYSEKTGAFQIEATIIGTNIHSKSEPIVISNGEIASLRVETPKEAVVDEKFEVKLIAVDRFSNIVKNFDKTRERLILESTGRGNLFPRELYSMNFHDGVAIVQVKYDRVEDIKLIVKSSRNSSIQGESPLISIKPPRVKRLEVIAPDSIVVGQKFKVKVVAYNELDKVMTNYSQYGKPVILKSTGTGNLLPNRIPPDAFTDGVAIVDLVYDRAENFKILATTEEYPVPTEAQTLKEERGEERKTKKRKPARKEEEKRTKTTKKQLKTLELNNISLTETDNRATLVLSIPEIQRIGRYRPKTIKAANRMTIELEITPAKNKLEIPVSFESEFVKKVTVNEKNSRLIVTVELKKPLRYRVLKRDDQLLIELRRA